MTRRDRYSGRGLGYVVLLIAAALILAGCSSPDGGTRGSTPAATSDNAAFPVTIDTLYGEITVNEKPERIFVYDASNLELLSRLGEKPSAWATGPSSREEALETFPYLADVFTTEPNPEAYDIDGATLSAEAIAVLEPDLILANPWSVDEPAYAQLSQIAPTYAGRKAKTNDAWQDTLADIASLTGHDPAAAVADAEAELKTAFAAAAKRLPGLQGATVQVPILGQAATGFAVGEIWGGSNAVFLGFGLKPGERQDAESTDVSFEEIGLLNADVLIVGASGKLTDEAREEGFDRLREDPRFPELPAAKNDAVIWLTFEEYVAVNGPTPASITWWLDQVVPRLEATGLNQSTR